MFATLRFPLFGLLVLLILSVQPWYSPRPNEANAAAQAALATLTPGTRTPIPTVTGWPTRTATPTSPPPPTMTTWATTPVARTPVPTVTGWPTRTPSPTPEPELTATPTPTSNSAPVLLQPQNGALMPQPVAPGEWYFAWRIRGIDCGNVITIEGPGGRSITGNVPSSGVLANYRYVTDSYLPDDALGPWTWRVRNPCHTTPSSETYTFFVQRNLVTPTPTQPPPTPTPYPQPATLLAPEDGAYMRQPVAPGEWYFAWEGESDSESGDCFSEIHLTGPNGQAISERVHSATLRYEYQHLMTEPLMGSNLGPWRWQVEVICPLGESLSLRRTFFVQPPSTYYLRLPLLR